MSQVHAPPAEALRPFAESNPLAGAEALRAQMGEQGYLFFRRLVPAEDVLAAIVTAHQLGL